MDETALYREIGGRLAARRRRLILTQSAVAKAAKLSRPSLANIELGRQTILLHQLYRLAEALELDGLESLLPTPREVAGAPVRLRLSEDNLSASLVREIEAFYESVPTSPSAEGA